MRRIRNLVARRRVRLIDLACAAVLVGGAAGCDARRAAGIDADAIRRVRVGMTATEVTDILGEPLRVRAWGEANVLFDYAIHGLTGPSLWIYFRDGRVSTVHAKQHHVLTEDRAIYEEAAHHATFEASAFQSAFASGRSRSR